MEQRLVGDDTIPAPDLHPARFADETDAVLEAGRAIVHEGHRPSLGELETHLPAEDGVASPSRGNSPCACDAAGPRGVGAVAPLRDVEMVNAPARDHAEREVA